MGGRGCGRGLDNRVYYMLAPEGQYYNYSGCGNTLNCNHPVVRRFILDCLRYWARARACPPGDAQAQAAPCAVLGTPYRMALWRQFAGHCRGGRTSMRLS